jgi:ATP-dependent Clp protease ATP-binding subunit ClpA
LTSKAKDYIIEQGYDAKMGARPLARKIDEMIKIPMSRKILFENLQNCNVVIDIKNGETVITTKARRHHVKNTENQ